MHNLRYIRLKEQPLRMSNFFMIFTLSSIFEENNNKFKGCFDELHNRLRKFAIHQFSSIS